MSNIVEVYKDNNKTYADIKEGDTVTVLETTDEAVYGRWITGAQYAVLESYNCRKNYANSKLLCTECITNFQAIVAECSNTSNIKQAVMCGCILGDINGKPYK